jgi:anti-anti-sigma regulatory factor
MYGLSFQQLTIGASIASYAALDAMSTRSQMLRITRKANGEVVFKISGQLNAQNVAEIGTLIEAEKKGSRIVLDLTDLRSVDGEAVKFLAGLSDDLEKWEADSIKLKNCSLYIREWIRRERLERESGKSPEI